jgi:hypothetical protein
MKYPTLPVPNTSREMVDVFRGYNHNLLIGDGEFFDMKNMTSNYYPILSPRGKRGVHAAPNATQGLIAKDGLCYVDGANFVINGYPVDMGLSTEAEDCPKQLISMGAYVIILPDKKWINTLDTTQFGNMEAYTQTTSDVTFELCTIDGEEYTGTIVSPGAPEDPENMDYWIDTSSTPHTLKQYSATSGMWVSIATTYIRISSPGIGKAFEAYDGVTISGVLNESLQDLNASMVLWGCGDDYIIVTGILDAVTTQLATDGAITIERRMPNMDFVIESENRLWGCKYGVANNGEVVNEIYASKLGDFKNWNCFMGLSTDSYAVTVGTDGPFTGAITHRGYPLFWKENCVHKVYGNFPANFQLQTTACRGVQKGCERSLAIVNEVLYYKAQHAVCAYDGSLPGEISAALGEEAYSEAVSGANGNKYYISMKDAADQYHLFVYDTAKGLWHKEDDLHADCFCACRGELYCVEHNSKQILTMLGSGEVDADDVSWMVQSGIIGTDMPDMKYISRLLVRMSLELGAKVRFFAQYNSMGEWEPLGMVSGNTLRTFQLPIRPRRCDHLRLRIEGIGDAKIYSITKTIEQGSDIS